MDLTTPLRIVRSISVLIVAAACCASCQSKYHSDPLAESQPPMLQVEAKSPGIMKRYSAFYIDEIGVYSMEGDHLRRLDNKEVRDLADEFRAKLIRSLGTRHSPIPQPASNVAVIKVALTDVSTTYAAFQILPGLVVPNAMRGGASIDAMVLDSVSRQPLVRVKDSRQGARQGWFSGLGKWDGAKRAFDEWAEVLADSVSQ